MKPSITITACGEGVTMVESANDADVILVKGLLEEISNLKRAFGEVQESQKIEKDYRAERAREHRARIAVEFGLKLMGRCAPGLISKELLAEDAVGFADELLAQLAKRKEAGDDL